MEQHDKAFASLVEMVRQAYGIDLRKKRTLVEGRLGKMMNLRGLNGLQEYIEVVRFDTSGQELIQLLNMLTTNHTYFMREPEHFVHFVQKALPEIASMAKDRDVRIWSAGCSTGQEPYTLVMLMDEYFSKLPGRWDHTVLATDISMRALEAAAEGVFDNQELLDLPKEWKQRYLKDLGDGSSRFVEKVRNSVIFRPFNLMEEHFPFKKKFHVIFCRNVMIYFEPDTKRELVRRFNRHTSEGGYLYIGQTESVSREVTGYRYVIPAVYKKEG